jgi:hypothetical protein
MRPYASFLIRCWQLPNGEQRIKMEHIQSGATLQSASMEEVVAWIATCLDESGAGSPVLGDGATDWLPPPGGDAAFGGKGGRR